MAALNTARRFRKWIDRLLILSVKAMSASNARSQDTVMSSNVRSLAAAPENCSILLHVAS